MKDAVGKCHLLLFIQCLDSEQQEQEWNAVGKKQHKECMLLKNKASQRRKFKLFFQTLRIPLCNNYKVEIKLYQSLMYQNVVNTVAKYCYKQKKVHVVRNSLKALEQY